ncbi:hypothetical protein J1N35_035339 [Gossypium stocksii]|uniref:Uncharacterized protein n=1 Tax=Gossypium stocksii TaxID=47602 RepID=A0A9D3UVI6_9ROSI|nr:hypothetical protein J1N35_035339 [Gossypium stocksii]
MNRVVGDEIVRSLNSPTTKGPDRIAWIGTSSGCFSIKSTYRKIKERSWNPREDA